MKPGMTKRSSKRSASIAAPKRAKQRLPRLEHLEDRTLLTVNPIVLENELPGTPQSQWMVLNGGDTSIQGFARDISVDAGQTISFSINDPSGAPYHLDIFRMGYYQGNGARLVATIPSSQTVRQTQPPPMVDYSTGLIDAGNWSISTSWNVPAEMTSGIYFANVRREDTGGASQIYFVVRDDDSHSDIMFQTSDSTWAAYNFWDGSNVGSGTSLYAYSGSNPALQSRGRAMAVSYNRPLTVDSAYGGLGNFNGPMHAEYPMVRWLEANGYDVTYTTDVDTARRGNLILNHQAFLSVGHDEYWSAEQLANVEAARDAGVNLAFFSGNSIFWKTRWSSSISTDSTSWRTVVTYKESQVNIPVDPMNQAPTWISTGTWRDLRFGAPSDGGKPENALMGTIYMNDRTSVDLGVSMNVPAEFANLRFWRNTAVAGLQQGQVATLGQYVVGYETDEDIDNGFRPAGLMQMSSTTFSTTSHVLVPWGTEVGPGVGTHTITLYRASSGALVFGAGTVQWSWGLDGNNNTLQVTPDPSMQQATVNLLADMGVQPAKLQPGLIAATASTDVTPPSTVITGPGANSVAAVGSSITIVGTATDSGGGVVAGVEISLDGGLTWRRANGRASWSYTWVVDQVGPIVIKSRAVDDSGNLTTTTVGRTITGYLQPTSTTGLVASYNFNEGSGTTLNDSSGKGNTGTISNATWAPGLSGQALSFNGSTSWVTINDSSTLDLTGGMTLEAWVKPTANSDYTTIFLKERTNGLSYGLYGSSGASQPPAAYVNSGGSDQSADGVSTLPLNTWSFLAATYDGSVLKLYVNGSLVSSRSMNGSIVTSTGVLRIGGNSIWGEYFQGLIDQVRIYNRPLNAGELLSDMNTPVGSGSVDTTPPTGSITSPASGSTISGVRSLTATASDNMLVASVQFLLNGANLGSEITTAPYVFSWDTRKFANGSYTLSAVITDFAGNTTLLPNRSVSVSNSADTTAPVVSLKNPGGKLYRGTVVPWAVASDAMGVTSVQFKLNGNNLGAADTTAPYRISWDTTTVPNGTYTLTAIARDQAGNTSSSSVTITIDNTSPVVTSKTPASGSTGVVTSGPQISATFSEAMQAGSIQFQVKSPQGYVVLGQVTYDPSTRIAKFIPNGVLEPSTTYTVVLSGALDLAGNPLIPVTWSFTTTSTVVNASLWGSSATPLVASANDTNAYELGLRFTSNIAGYVMGVRFYKGPANIGTHVGHLWNAAGQLLGSVTFTDESSQGWQQAMFSQPIAILAGAVYTVSYFAPSGGYAANANYFATSGVDTGPLHALSTPVSGGNGVFRESDSGFPTSSYNSTNYWVDVVFSNVLLPYVFSTTPTDNASGIPATSPQITAKFSKAVQPATINFTLRGPSGSLIAATVVYDTASGLATLTPVTPLSPSTTYTATVNSVVAVDGTQMTTPYSWAFTTAPVDTTAPTILSVTPSSGANFVSNAAPALSVLAVFSEAVQPSTISFVLRDASGNIVPSTFAYDTATRTVGLIPNQAVSFGATYTATLSGALDLSGNTMESTSWSFTTNPITNASLFPASATPAVASSNDTSALELGVKFTSDVGGYVTGVSFYKGAMNLGTHVAHIWAANDTLQFGACPGCPCGSTCFLQLAQGTLLASATFTNETATGWQDVSFSLPVLIMPNVTYIVSYSAPNGGFAYDDAYFTTTGVTSGVLRAPSSSMIAGNGVFGAINSFPTSTYNGRNYWVQPIFSNNKTDLTAPTVSSTTPASGASGVGTTQTVSVTFNENVNPNTVTFLVTDPSGQPVPMSASWSSSTGDPSAVNTLALTPVQPLNPLTKYTVTISGVVDLAGNVMTNPVNWSFTTIRSGTESTVWTSDTTPAVASADDLSSVVLGMKFTADVPGTVLGVRFYKGSANTGTHVGYLWTATGTLLASVTFSNETATGWQEAIFNTPVAISADTVYVIGYLAPSGGYAYTSNYFTSLGTNPGPLHPLPAGTPGGNGVFAYGSNLFPSNSYNATNYWVDVVFHPSASQLSTTTVLNSSANPVILGRSVTLTATVAAAGSGTGTPSGTVTFMDGSTVLETVALNGGVATFTNASLAAGSHTIWAVYNGASTFLSSTSQTISQSVNQALLVNAMEAGTDDAEELTQDMLAPIVARAIQLWGEAGANAQTMNLLNNIVFQITDLPETLLGMAGPGVITLDKDAAGYGWFVDTTPGDSTEFTSNPLALALDHIDLLSVIAHELGHELGLEHDTGDDVMNPALSVGERRIPIPGSLASLSSVAGLTTGTVAAPIDRWLLKTRDLNQPRVLAKGDDDVILGMIPTPASIFIPLVGETITHRRPARVRGRFWR